MLSLVHQNVDKQLIGFGFIFTVQSEKENKGGSWRRLNASFLHISEVWLSKL